MGHMAPLLVVNTIATTYAIILVLAMTPIGPENTVYHFWEIHEHKRSITIVPHHIAIKSLVKDILTL